MRRQKILNFCLFAASVVFFSYIFYIQCIRYAYYDNRARNQHEKKFILFGSRGNIYDRNGLPLATSSQCFSIFCTPRYTTNKKRLVRELSILSNASEYTVHKQVEKGTFFWVERKVDLNKRDQYLDLDDPSIGYTYDLKRHYNMPENFVSILGACGSDNRGIEGLELQLDDVLSGEGGFAIYQRDPTGDLIPYHNNTEKEPTPGKDVYLTIDLQVQSILAANLQAALVSEDAHHAAGIVIQPRTGEILALVNVGRNNDTRNHVVCDEFEPGSTFKLLTLTYALLHGKNEQETIDTEGGTCKIHGHTIHDYRDYGTVTLAQAIAHSSNVAMVKISKDFDREAFCMLARDFGFGQLTGIELPGEVKGRLPDHDSINDVEFATLVFGQGLTVNLLQLAFAYQAVANRGVLNRPVLIKEIRNGSHTAYAFDPLRIRRVITKDITERLTAILCGVVEQGSGQGAAMEGVRIAAKTGTSQKVVNGTYSNRSIITTFVGFFPAESPDYLIAILLDEPKKGLWASTIAAPIFKKIAQSIYQINAYQYAAE
ncbi:penicillin-binding protein 2 [candidate division WOR-3 bacterium]|nr:penicillin-binding protein 2 [candidate division WOR-3 bacterium]